MQMLERALEIARVVHTGEVDKAGRPVIDHVLRVVDAVEGEDVRIVAALHDVLETGALTPDELAADGPFPPDIVEDVETLTRWIWTPSYAAYIDRVVAGSARARTVKIADLRDHLHPDRVGALTPSHVERYRRALAQLGATQGGVDGRE